MFKKYKVKKWKLLLLERFEWEPEVTYDQIKPLKDMFNQMSIIHINFVSWSLTVSEILLVLCFYKRKLPEIFWDVSSKVEFFFWFFTMCRWPFVFLLLKCYFHAKYPKYIKKTKLAVLPMTTGSHAGKKQNSVNACLYIRLSSHTVWLFKLLPFLR